MLRVVSILSCLCFGGFWCGHGMFQKSTPQSQSRPFEEIQVSIKDDEQANKQVEFDAFGEHYELHLSLNEHLLSPHFEFVNTEEPADFRSKQANCHYHGTLVSTDSSAIVSASLCEGHGVRARITSFGRTLIIKPAAAYLDPEKDMRNEHALSDDVVAYFLGSTDDDPVNRMFHAANASASKRRRLAVFNWWNTGTVELYVIIDPVRTANNGYGTLGTATLTHVNAVSAIYKATDWGTVGGTNSIVISLRFMEYVSSFSSSGLAAPAKAWSGGSCNSGTYSSDAYCAVDAQSYIQKVKDYVQVKDWKKFDVVLLLTDMMFNWQWTSGGGKSGTVGIGSLGSICGTGRNTVSLTSLNTWIRDDDASSVATTAHEIGHNFGFGHDAADNNCGVDSGLMGYGSNTADFSSCSRSTMQTHTAASLACLATDGSGSTSVQTVSHANSLEDVSGHSCITVQGFSSRSYLNGKYSRGSDPFNGVASYEFYYSASYTFYLYYMTDYRKWFIGATPGATSGYAFCGSSSFDAVDCVQGLWENEWSASASAGCSGGALVSDDMICLDDDDAYVGEIACLFNQNATALSWQGSIAEFELVEGHCKQGDVVYQLGLSEAEGDEDEEYTTGDDIEELDLVDSSDDVVYFLFLREELRYIGSNVTWARWMIATDVSSTDPVAYCENTVLRECVKGEWKVRHMSDDSISIVLDVGFGLDMSDCVYDDVAAEDEGTSGALVVLLVLLAVFALLVVAALLFVRQRRGRRSVKNLEVVQDNEDAEEADEVAVSAAAEENQTLANIATDN